MFFSGQFDQVKDVLEYFESTYDQKKKKGFFVEAGAFDGEKFSNTLRLEQDFGWSGLLVEANPDLYAKVKSKHRNSISINSCISLSQSPVSVEFLGAEGFIDVHC